MPPSIRVDQGTIIILDVGRNVSEYENKNEKNFFENAKECTKRIIERKIISKDKNLVGIVLLGSKKTKNNMAQQCEGTFKHVELFMELQTPTWKMIRELPETTCKSRGDWIDALIVAADHFQNGISGYIIANKKILLMTNFMTPTSYEKNEIVKILTGFQDENYEVNVIGIDLDNQDISDKASADIEVAQQFVSATHGVTATFDYTMTYLLFHQKKTTKPVPWNVNLSIGPYLKIPVSSYIRLRNEPVVKDWRNAIRDPITHSSSTTEGVVKCKEYINSENQSISKYPQTVKGLYFGQQIIPLTECEAMLYKSGDKCLSVYGFTHASNITWQNLNGDGLSYIFGRKGDKNAQNAIRCFAECMHELDLVAIARRVYNNNNAPKMFVLMPVIDTNNYVCLSMIGICYKDDIKYMKFPLISLKKYTCSNEQVSAFKELIKAMDLTRAYDETFDDSEAFPIAETVSPSAQYILDCIAHRAMNPGKPLPQPRDEIMSMFKVPPLIEKRSREPLDKLKSLFKLNKVEVKKKNRKVKSKIDTPYLAEDTLKNTPQSGDGFIPKVELPVNVTDEIEKISSINPIGDFKALINKGKSLANLSNEITEVIENLIYCNLDGDYCKVLDTITFFREECVKNEPSIYNDWIKKFMTTLKNRKRCDILSLINERHLNVILKSENCSSIFETWDDQNVSQLYENDTLLNSMELSVASDVNNMFDDM